MIRLILLFLLCFSEFFGSLVSFNRSLNYQIFLPNDVVDKIVSDIQKYEEQELIRLINKEFYNFPFSFLKNVRYKSYKDSRICGKIVEKALDITHPLMQYASKETSLATCFVFHALVINQLSRINSEKSWTKYFGENKAEKDFMRFMEIAYGN